MTFWCERSLQAPAFQIPIFVDEMYSQTHKRSHMNARPHISRGGKEIKVV